MAKYLKIYKDLREIITLQSKETLEHFNEGNDLALLLFLNLYNCCLVENVSWGWTKKCTMR